MSLIVSESILYEKSVYVAIATILSPLRLRRHISSNVRPLVSRTKRITNTTAIAANSA